MVPHTRRNQPGRAVRAVRAPASRLSGLTNGLIHGLIPALVLALVMAAPAPAFAGNHDGKAKGQGKAGGQGKPAVERTTGADAGDRLEEEIIDAVLDGIFGENERTVIERYARSHDLAGQSLPPGIAKNVRRGKPLPPGIAKRGLPGELTDQLPTLREGLERVIVGDDVTIVEAGTRVVVDILKDVLRPRE